MAYQAPWRIDGDHRRQRKLAGVTDEQPTDVVDALLKPMRDRAAMDRAFRPNHADIGSVGRAVLRDAQAGCDQECAMHANRYGKE